MVDSQSPESAASAQEMKVCPACGLQWDEGLKTGYLGCPKCYEAFRSMLLDALSKLQSR